MTDDFANAMHPFTRLPGSQRHPSGLEWVILRKLPSVLLYGSGLLMLVFLLLRFGTSDLDMKQAMTAQYALLGALLFHWMCVLGTGLCCAIIWIMKGPAYVMDPYYLPDHEIQARD